MIFVNLLIEKFVLLYICIKNLSFHVKNMVLDGYPKRESIPFEDILMIVNNHIGDVLWKNEDMEIVFV